MKTVYSSMGKTILTFALRISLMLILAAAIALPAAAQGLVTFAQFIERNGAQDFAVTNTNSGVNFSTVSNGAPIFFRYQNIANLDSSLEGFQEATLTLSASSNVNAINASNILIQPISGSINQIQILRDSPAAVGLNSRRNLLTVTFGPAGNSPAFVGANNGNSATFSATTPDNVVTFSSDFIRFNFTTQRNLALSFSSVVNALAIDPNGFLQTLTAAGSGTFASNPAPLIIVPSAASVTLGGRVLNPDGRPVSKAIVYLSGGSGEPRTVTTDFAGYYRFENVRAGNSVILSVIAKRYHYQPIVLTPSESIEDIDFLAQ